MLTLREADTAQLARYQAAVERLLARGDRLSDEQVRKVFAVLRDARRQVMADLAQLGDAADGAGFKAYQLRSLQEAIDRAALDLVADFKPVMGSALDLAWEAGAQYQVDALDSIGIDLALRGISRAQLVVAHEVAADLVQHVGDTFKQQGRSLIARAVLGDQSPFATIQAVAKLLKTEKGRTDARLGPIPYQSERIVRTELMGVFNISNRVRHEQIAGEVPGMRKAWLATFDARTRPDHAGAGVRYAIPDSTIPWNEDFIVGGERAQYPHDPRLSGKQRINCRCTAIQWHPDWAQAEEDARRQ